MILALMLTAGGFAAAAELPPGGTFTDDDGNIHEGSIEAIAAEGITKGCNPPLNDQFCPDATVTRGQMAAFLVRALGLADDGGGNSFIDDDGSVFENDIAKLAAAAITRGCNPPDNTMFCPDASVTRGQMAAFLVRAMGYTDDGGGDLFTDDDGSVFESDIDRLGSAGVTSGCNPPDNDRYCPDDPVTRGQMASFLTRALGLTPIVPPPSGVPDACDLLSTAEASAAAGNPVVFDSKSNDATGNSCLYTGPVIDIVDAWVLDITFQEFQDRRAQWTPIQEVMGLGQEAFVGVHWAAVDNIQVNVWEGDFAYGTTMRRFPPATAQNVIDAGMTMQSNLP